jgi:hypothetical protein
MRPRSRAWRSVRSSVCGRGDRRGPSRGRERHPVSSSKTKSIERDSATTESMQGVVARAVLRALAQAARVGVSRLERGAVERVDGLVRRRRERHVHVLGARRLRRPRTRRRGRRAGRGWGCRRGPRTPRAGRSSRRSGWPRRRRRRGSTRGRCGRRCAARRGGPPRRCCRRGRGATPRSSRARTAGARRAGRRRGSPPLCRPARNSSTCSREGASQATCSRRVGGRSAEAAASEKSSHSGGSSSSWVRTTRSGASTVASNRSDAARSGTRMVTWSNTRGTMPLPRSPSGRRPRRATPRAALRRRSGGVQAARSAGRSVRSA